MFEISSDTQNTLKLGAKIKVIGVGGGGCNAINTMIRAGLSGVEYIVANTDLQALSASLAQTKVQLGVELTKGLGAGANPEIGRKAALDEYEKLTEVLKDADMVFVTCGMGGGTGTGAAPVIAKLSRELGALTVGVVTKPFSFEGKKRAKYATEGIDSLKENVDSLIIIPNQKLLILAGTSLSLIDTFKKADDILLNAVRGISDLINNTGLINADFADVKTIMSNKGLALMGIGHAEGDQRAALAATAAISSPLLEDISIDGATGIIINITGGNDLTTHETNEAVSLIMESADEDAEIIFGTVIDESINNTIKITVIATGLKQEAQDYIRPTVTLEVKPEASTPNLKTSLETKEETLNIEETSLKETHTEAKEEIATVLKENKESVEQKSSFSLAESIREAALAYGASKPAPSLSNTATKETKTKEFPPRRPIANFTNRDKTKSIGEQLGFINFDEEELDRPTYLRKEELENPNTMS